MPQSTIEIPPSSTLPEVLTLEEAAAYLRVSQDDVLEALQHQRLPGRQVRQQWRFLKAAIEDWLRTSPAQRERIMQLAGAWGNDPYNDEMMDEVFQRRGRPMVEETE